jgi:NADPH-dependent ferric siderophore reductase
MGLGSVLLRLLGVAAFAAAPGAALDTGATPGITTGDAVAVPPEGGLQNTGGNVEVGKGESNSTVVIGDPAAAPALPGVLAVVPKTVAPPKNPASDAVARAHALVEEAKARAQAQIDAARANAERAVDEARRTAEEAQARGQQQSEAARANAEAASAQSNP